GASPLGLPYTLTREPLRRLAPFAWLASLRSLALHTSPLVNLFSTAQPRMLSQWVRAHCVVQSAATGENRRRGVQCRAGPGAARQSPGTASRRRRDCDCRPRLAPVLRVADEQRARGDRAAGCGARRGDTAGADRAAVNAERRNSQFPTPNSQFPTPNSQLPTP